MKLKGKIEKREGGLEDGARVGALVPGTIGKSPPHHS
jgi:hypothetical protein